MVDGGGADERPAEAPLADPSDPTALEALRPLASTEVALTPSLTHREVYTSRGLLTVFRHRPPEGVAPQRAAIVACGGALGGVLGPGHALYQRLGERWAERGVEFVRVGYREPNNLDLCAHDLACGVELARDAGADRVVVMGHSFGGAVAIRTAVIMPVTVAGITNAAPYSYAIGGITGATGAVVSQAGMRGGNGGWAVLYGANPISDTAVDLAIDEDQLSDIERSHLAEQVAYLIF